MRWRVGTALGGALLLSGVAACVAVPAVDGPVPSSSKVQPAGQLHFTAAGELQREPRCRHRPRGGGRATPTSTSPSATSPTVGRASEDPWCRFVTDRVVGMELPFRAAAGNHESDGSNG